MKNVLICILKLHKNYYKEGVTCSGITAPLYQQVFDWFREKYNLYGFIDNTCIQLFQDYHVRINKTNLGITGLEYDRVVNLFDFKTYEEARLACLNKLIEITNQIYN